MVKKNEAIQHDADVWDYRARVQGFMLKVAKMHLLLGGESNQLALAVSVAENLNLWEDDEMPFWVDESAEWAVEKADADFATARELMEEMRCET